MIIQEFHAQPNDSKTLQNAITYCGKNQVIFIVARLDCLSKDDFTILAAKKKLGSLFMSCDLPNSDSLTLSIALGLQKRKSELASIQTKAALQIRKAKGKKLGNPQNLTLEGRALGFIKIFC